MSLKITCMPSCLSVMGLGKHVKLHLQTLIEWVTAPQQMSDAVELLYNHWLLLPLACTAGGACRPYSERHQVFRSHMAVPSFGEHGKIFDFVRDTSAWVD